MKHTLKWFKNRIGKKAYRDDNGCTCPHCKEITKNGLIIADEYKASYLYAIQGDIGICYRDKK